MWLSADRLALSSPSPRPCVSSRYIGAAVSWDLIRDSPEPYGNIVSTEFNQMTLEDQHTWGAMLSQEKGKEGVYDFEAADAAVNWGVNHGLEVKGHALVWHQCTPPWLEKMSTSRVREALYIHITKIMNHFYHNVRVWDVLNEILSYDGSGRMNKGSIFYKRLGSGYVEEVLRVAHHTDPNCKLLINDMHCESAGLPGSRSAKSDALFGICKDLLDRGVPLNGVGLECHLNASGTQEWAVPTPHSVVRNIRRYGELGMSVNISEMDVRTSGMELPERYRDAAQEVIYRDLLAAAYMEPNFDGATLWGVSDKDSWVHNFFPSVEAERPLLWDTSFQKKPAYYGVDEALQCLCGDGEVPAVEGVHEQVIWEQERRAEQRKATQCAHVHGAGLRGLVKVHGLA
ncbi:unnamed protein product [Chrysoparadoxa australica]